MSFTYRGTTSDSMFFNVTERQVYNAPAFDVNAIEVPGRSGDVLNSQQRFKNKTLVYTGFIRSSDFPGNTQWERLSRGLRNIKAWICGDAGKYHDLTDDYDPGYVRRAFVSGETAITEIFDRPDGATITITFLAEPFMYEVSEPIEVPESDTANGSIATFEGVDAPLKSLSFSIAPNQDLHGYDYPWPAGGGANKYNYANWEYLNLSRRYWGSVSASMLTTLNSLPAGTYTVVAKIKVDSVMSSDTSDRTYGFLFLGVYVEGRTTQAALPVGSTFTVSKTFTISAAQVGTFTNVYWYASSATATDDLATITDVGIMVGSGTAYAPYSNICPISGWSQVDGKQSGEDMTDYTPITIALGQTVYGAREDAIRGKLVIDQVKVTLNGTQTISLANWRPTATGVGWLYSQSALGNKVYTSDQAVQKIVSNKLKTVNYATAFGATQDNIVSSVAQANGISSYGLAVRISDTSLTTTAAINAYLAANPIDVVYELATPIEVDLTPVSGLTSLLGQNNIWANTGDTTVEYIVPTENPTAWPSQPRLEITMSGAGTLTVNGKTWSIGAYTGTLICDSEIMDWYDPTALRNNLITGDGFPELVPGENLISYTGGITKVVAIPRWRTL